ncbi:hypothetical protein MEX01_16940 [Methylorubrum extorquens]|nr:hypothetical protein MEX01_16940 [Methylorubrum extorquens]
MAYRRVDQSLVRERLVRGKRRHPREAEIDHLWPAGEKELKIALKCLPLVSQTDSSARCIGKSDTSRARGSL